MVEDLHDALTMAERSRRGFELFQRFEAGTLDNVALSAVSVEEWEAASAAADMLDSLDALERPGAS